MANEIGFKMTIDVGDEKPAKKKNKTENSVRNHNVGKSDYSKHKIQPWDIWIEYFPLVRVKNVALLATTCPCAT